LFADRKDLIDAQERALKASTAKPRRLARVRVPGHQEDVTASGVEGKPLAGQVVVLTGEFEGGKGVLATLAASAGCDVEANFTKSRTTILVLGHRNHDVWGYAKSGKHLRAEEAIAEGRNVQIMTEEEFRLLINNSISSGALKAAI
jgi:BRCT domain type II-containing protein